MAWLLQPCQTVCSLTVLLCTITAQGHKIKKAGTTMIYNPGGSTLNGTAFSAFLKNAQSQSSVTAVQLTAGTYTVTPYSSSTHIYLLCSPSRTTHFEINLSGSTLLYANGNSGGVVLDTCTRVYMHGPATLTYPMAQYPYAQATVLTVSADYLTYTVQIHAAFLATWLRILAQYGAPTGGGVVYDGTGAVLAPWYGGTDFYVQQGTVAQVSGSVYSFTLSRDPGIVVVGNQVTLKQPTINSGIAMYNGQLNNLTNLNLQTAPGFGIYDGTAKGTNYLTNVQLAPSTTPGSDGNVPLMSSISDGFHSTSALTGYQVIGCSVISTGDDMVAVHGRMYTMAVTSNTGSYLTVGAYTGGPPELNAGDTVSLYTPYGAPLGSATVKSVASTTQPSNVNPSATDIVFGNTFSGYQWWKLVLTSFPSAFATAPFNSFLTVPTRSGAGYSVQNSYIANGRGNGIIARGINGLIQNNTIYFVALTSLNFAPGFDSTHEGGFPGNLMVMNNYLNGYGQAILLGSNIYATSPFNQPDMVKITFTNNTIANSQFGVVVLESANTVTMTKTSFINVMCSNGTTNTRAFSWQLPYTPVQTNGVTNIKFSSNTFTVTSTCQQNLANLASPYYFTNTSGVSGNVNPSPAVPMEVLDNNQLWGLVIYETGGNPSISSTS